MTGRETTAERHVLLAGGTSEAGWAVARRLRAGGVRVSVAGRSASKLEEFAAEGFETVQVDLADADAVDRAFARLDRLDGLFPLVGGWRGGGGIPGQSDDDWAALEVALTAVRHACRAAWPLLDVSPAARVAVVSSTAVARPLAGGANYAAMKAATEAWIHAVAHGFAKSARDAGRDQTGGCTIFRVKALAGLEQTIGARFAALWDADPSGASADIVTLEAPAG
ncbi:SDR family NAD(P)-dependent oxidoreductase [Microbacterium karelineae]|uniref:SDR family NAD(P)-dependent oxidoreductase n=1 Tax=Microbacterium karelineae TaxID=2654283 RepID=UPI0012EA6E56|nr:SDR family NAD(P)-dependent oxidoreductase [Microbacterium karelineae]